MTTLTDLSDGFAAAADIDNDVDSQAEEAKDLKKVGQLTKRRYRKFSESLRAMVSDADTHDRILRLLLDVVKFDPHAPTYDAEVYRKRKLWLQKRAAETGKTAYELQGRDKYYREHKAELNKKRSEQRRRAKAVSRAMEEAQHTLTHVRI